MIILDPVQIEKRSFEIIGEELKVTISPENELVVKRVIHCSADFDYAVNLRFSDGAVRTALSALRDGCDIVTDTQMAKSGINKTVLASLGGEVHCFMSDEDVALQAKQRGTTRAEISMEKAAELDRPLIFAIGNAPTALLKLHELIQTDKFSPILVIGVPVGFVNIIEAKELIMSSSVPHIVSAGRKGGSNIAAAIINALLYQIKW